MWDLSSTFQSRLRTIFGLIVFFGFFAALGFTSYGSIAQDFFYELSSNTRKFLLEKERRFKLISATPLPKNLENTLIYLENPNGQGSVFGYIEKIPAAESSQNSTSNFQYIAVLPPQESLPFVSQKDFVLSYTPPPSNLKEALHLILAPDSLESEFQTFQHKVGSFLQEQGVLDQLEKDLSKKLKGLSSKAIQKKEPELNTLVQALYQELNPEIQNLTERMVSRAWGEIGLVGIAEETARQTGKTVEKVYQDANSKVKSLLGYKTKKRKKKKQGFLSDERKEALETAIEDEFNLFWTEHKADILTKTQQTLLEHETLLDNLIQEEFLPYFSQDFFQELLQEHEANLFESISLYSNDFSKRKVLTHNGSLRLNVLYCIRSIAGFSYKPLLVLKPAQDLDQENSSTKHFFQLHELD